MRLLSPDSSSPGERQEELPWDVCQAWGEETAPSQEYLQPVGTGSEMMGRGARSSGKVENQLTPTGGSHELASQHQLSC